MTTQTNKTEKEIINKLSKSLKLLESIKVYKCEVCNHLQIIDNCFELKCCRVCLRDEIIKELKKGNEVLKE